MSRRRLLALAVAVIASVALTAGCDSDDREKAICVIAAKGIAQLPNLHPRGEGLSNILQFVEPGLEAVCEQQLRAFLASPNSEFSFKIETPTGDLLPRSFSFEEIAAPPTTVPSTEAPDDRLNRVIPCYGTWETDVLIDMCIDGHLDP